jgi:hypothetical protein
MDFIRHVIGLMLIYKNELVVTDAYDEELRLIKAGFTHGSVTVTISVDYGNFENA